MTFMQKQVVLDLWVQIDGNCGIDSVPASIIPWPVMLADTIRDGAGWSIPAPDDTQESWGLWEALCEAVKDYTESRDIAEIEIRRGYGARLSAPGYMDCTPWSVYDSESEALESLADYDDSDSEESES